ncbi:hypothetical protein KYI09_09520 [Macrococcoides caseolyticum]|nr:hypothetical protein [Macrococcus caseolyticus]QYA39791.1 hypothetical protein KYI09_09520 [Macrococcus caseolyticus]
MIPRVKKNPKSHQKKHMIVKRVLKKIQWSRMEIAVVRDCDLFVYN